MRAFAVACLIGGSLISGCDKHQAGQGQAPSAAGGGVASPIGLPARPHLKAGLWRTSMTTRAGPGVTMTGELCLDAGTEDSAFGARPRSVKNCDPVRFDLGPGGYTFSSTCHFGGRTIVTKGVASGDFRTTYAMDMTTRMTPAPPGLPPEMHSRVEATWAGPCRPDQKPGQASMKFGGLGRG